MAFSLIVGLSREPDYEKGPKGPFVIDRVSSKRDFWRVANGEHIQGIWVACTKGHIEYLPRFEQMYMNEVHVDYGPCRYPALYSGKCERLKRFVLDQELWDAAYRVGGFEAVEAMFDKKNLSMRRRLIRFPPGIRVYR